MDLLCRCVMNRIWPVARDVWSQAPFPERRRLSVWSLEQNYSYETVNLGQRSYSANANDVIAFYRDFQWSF